VVITAYQDGFAIVQPWDEFLRAREANAKPAFEEKRQEA
jgi:hypothetical protein